MDRNRQPAFARVYADNGAFMTQRPPHLTVVPPADCGDDGDDRWTQELCAVAERQDREAFARLFAHFAPRIKSYLQRGGTSPGQAEELAQDALVAVWRKAQLFDPARSGAATWIFAIARNRRIDVLRRHQGDSAGDEEMDFDVLEDEGPGPEAHAEARGLERRLKAAITQLPPEQAQVLHLSYYEDCAHARIATELGIPLGTVKSRVRLAVAQLRRLMEP